MWNPFRLASENRQLKIDVARLKEARDLEIDQFNRARKEHALFRGDVQRFLKDYPIHLRLPIKECMQNPEDITYDYVYRFFGTTTPNAELEENPKIFSDSFKISELAVRQVPTDILKGQIEHFLKNIYRRLVEAMLIDLKVL